MDTLRKALRSSFGWFKLLIYAEPKPMDIILLVLGTVTAVLSGMPVPVLGIVFGQLMDDLNTASCDATTQNAAAAAILQSNINGKVLVVVYIAVINFALIYIYILTWNLFGERLARRIRERYLQNMLHKDVQFFDHMSPGEVSNHLNADINTIKQGTSQKVGIVINAVAFFVTAYTIAFIKNAKLGGILVSLTPAFLIMSLVGGHFVGKYTVTVSTAVASASSVALEALSNITIVHAFGANTKLEERFAELLDTAKKAGIRKAIAASIQAGLLFFIAYSANATAYYLGSRQIADAVERDGGTTVGEIYTVVFILVDATIILSVVAPFLQLFGAAQASFSKLKDNIERKLVISDGPTTTVAESLAASIELRNVTFTYSARLDVKAIDQVSLSIPEGTHTAIVGPSGSGKSTIASLLVRFYDPLSGDILLGGLSLKDIPCSLLRQYTSFVQQDATLFDRSILENIALGLISSQKHVHLSRLLKSDTLAIVAERVHNGEDIFQVAKAFGSHCIEIVDLVTKAATQADADLFIQRLQGGYGTSVGVKGTLISGGQKQRIALARALVKNPKILVLDEATGSLDSSSERKIQAALATASLGRTTITIAHRLSTIRDADNIVVMRDGQVVEQGSHKDLLAVDGAYAELLRLQRNDDQQSAGPNERADRDKDANMSIDAKVHPTASSREMADNGAESNSKGTPEHTSKDPDIGAKRSISYVARSLAWTFRPSLLVLCIALLAVLIVGSTYSAAAVIFGNTIGALSPCRTPPSIRSAGEFFALMFFILAIIEFFANIISWSGLGLVAERVLFKIRVLSFRSLVEQNLQWHESANRTPKSLLSLITTDGSALSGLTGSTIGTILSISVNMVAAIILTHIVAWKIALVCLAVVPLIIGSGTMHLVVLARFATKHADAFTNSVGIAVEAVESIKTINALSLQDEILATYCRSLKAPIKEMTRQGLYADFWLALAYGIPTFLYALSFWWGGTLLLRGEYTQVEYYICTIALLVSAQLWGQLFTIAPDLSKAFAAVQRIVNLINLSATARLGGQQSQIETNAYHNKNSMANASDREKLAIHSTNTILATSQTTTGSQITFENVNFSYPARPNVQVLNNITFKIRPGQFCALVGPSGAGKSTIVALLERMYRPSSGAITIDKTDISFAPISFRDSIAYVPQESVLFDGSIRFNLSLGASPSAPPVTDKDLDTACRLANIHSKIASLPNGYDTPVGTSGNQFSGGEKQRLAIARALIRKPRLLLLDESTSALDAESERKLRSGLDSAREETGMTVVAIAHRLTTIRDADVIFLVENGSVVDSGNHDQLMARGGAYRENAKYQGF